MHKIEDSQLVKLCGTDAALYLVFLRYTSVLFAVISLINLVFLVIYITGNPRIDELLSIEKYPMEFLTIFNVTNNTFKVSLCFIYSIIVVPSLVFAFIFRYLTILDHKKNHKHNADDLKDNIINEIDISEHAIMIQGFPKNIPKDKLENIVENILIEILKNENIYNDE